MLEPAGATMYSVEGASVTGSVATFANLIVDMMISFSVGKGMNSDDYHASEIRGTAKTTPL